MPVRNIDWDGYRGLTRLLLLAVVLAVVLWWAVAIGGSRRPLSKPVPRTPPNPPPGKRARTRFGTSKVALDEVIVFDEDEVPPASIIADDDYWPDIIDA